MAIIGLQKLSEKRSKVIEKSINSGDKNISILHSPCRTSDLQFSLVLQTHALVLKKCMGGGGGGGGGG